EVAAGVQDDKTTRPIGRLDHAGLKAGLADGRRLLVAGDAEDRNRRAQDLRTDRAKISGTVEDLGQHLARHPQDLQEFVVPFLRGDVEEQRARSVRGIRCMYLATGE